MIALIARDGRQLAPTYAGPRYVAESGAIRDHAAPHAPLSLPEAELRLAALTERTLREKPAIGRLLARDALSLERAIRAARLPATEPRRWAWPFNQGARA